MAIKLGLLKWEQVRLLDEHLDAAFETGQPNLRDQDAVEFLHQQRTRRTLDQASQTFGLDLLWRRDHSAHLADHRVQKLNRAGSSGTGSLVQPLIAQLLQDLRGVIVILPRIDDGGRQILPGKLGLDGAGNQSGHRRLTSLEEIHTRQGRGDFRSLGQRAPPMPARPPARWD